MRFLLMKFFWVTYRTCLTAHPPHIYAHKSRHFHKHKHARLKLTCVVVHRRTHYNLAYQKVSFAFVLPGRGVIYKEKSFASCCVCTKNIKSTAREDEKKMYRFGTQGNFGIFCVFHLSLDIKDILI